ncbi:ATP-binding protein [Streptomyces sp. NPDC059168]|uniref:ATP-binding protein n=1 Tax=Streptomyces sp. NPDC059168 TaxID=3346753 RepID=UPI0036C202F4
MVIPLRNQAPDGREPAGPLRYSTVWNEEQPPIADARQAVRTLLARAGHAPEHRACQDAQLVVSELVTNAHRHAPGPGGLELEVVGDAALLRITVRDGSPLRPELQEHDVRRVGGHGLRLVTRLCAQLHTVALEGGKQVVAHLHLLGPAPDQAQRGPGDSRC